MTFIFNVYSNRVCVYVWRNFFSQVIGIVGFGGLNLFFLVILSELIVHCVIVIYSRVVLACYLCHFVKSSFKNGGFFTAIKIWLHQVLVFKVTPISLCWFQLCTWTHFIHFYWGILSFPLVQIIFSMWRFCSFNCCLCCSWNNLQDSIINNNYFNLFFICFGLWFVKENDFFHWGVNYNNWHMWWWFKWSHGKKNQ
jgi:hypothetical protein